MHRHGGTEIGFTPLMAAAQDGDPVLARILLDAGADTSAREQNGKTARDFAREGGHTDVEALLPTA